MDHREKFLTASKIVCDIKKLDADCKKYARDNNTTYTYITVTSGLHSSVLCNAENRAFKYEECKKYADSYERVGIMTEEQYIATCEAFHLNKDDYILEVVAPVGISTIKQKKEEPNNDNIQLISDFISENSKNSENIVAAIEKQNELLSQNNQLLSAIIGMLENLGKCSVQTMETVAEIQKAWK